MSDLYADVQESMDERFGGKSTVKVLPSALDDYYRILVTTEGKPDVEVLIPRDEGDSGDFSVFDYLTFRVRGERGEYDLSQLNIFSPGFWDAHTPAEVYRAIVRYSPRYQMRIINGQIVAVGRLPRPVFAGGDCE